MKVRAYISVSAFIFTLVGLIHVIRFAQGWPVVLGSMSVPLWVSVVAALLSVGVAMWGLSLLRRNKA